ncbi:YhgE/Pip domain-containing protein [Lederbergia lenta]|uniref:YhgE/Pip domain-containing protein n=1 Tax=Lederbergia lenta TaxID=1467 RepID=UPI00204134A5|nr:YhgE/Pip domain-containing protein [Lederbergia lenta]MCM3113160.1 YhgE/Pip domain-containing protein [Lederbergia lenta]
MRNIWKIFTSDVKNISKNWVAAVLIGGLIFLPSLYAWLNIIASWDPYSQTDQMPVAVVNEDVGATVRDNQIDAGKELVKTLKTNKDMGWEFTNRKKAMEKLEYGDYFSVIIIPKDFSEKLASVISDKPEKATMEYYVNEKINSIAPKITGKGASVIVEKMSGQFVSTVNGVIFDLFNDLGIEIENDLPDIKRFEQYIFDVEANLPEINQKLKESLIDATSAQNILRKAQNLMPEAQRLTNEGLGTINSTTEFLTKAENRLNEMAPKINEDLQKVQSISKESNEFLIEIQSVDLDFTELENVKKQMNERMNSAISTVETIEADLKHLRDINNAQPSTPAEEEENEVPSAPIGGAELDDAIEKTAALKVTLVEVQNNVENVNGLVEGKQQQLKQAIDDMQQIAAGTSIKLDTFIKDYKETIEPKVFSEVANAKKTLLDAKEILVGIQSTIPEVERIINNTDGHVSDGTEVIEKILGEFPYVNDKVRQLADRIRKVQGEMDIGDIIELLQNDPEAKRSFFEEPIVLKENKLFPIENYGTGMTPFYTVLAIWVGCLLLISLLAVDVKHEDNYFAREVYFGRLFTFITIGILQTLIVTSGDMVLLGVKVQEPFWFIVFGLFISLIFMSIVYTLVSVFGDVGKALAIIMLVLQIAGSGGTYPVALLPEFFQWINPVLPFTYAIDLMREAVGGIVWRRVGTDILYLACVGIAFQLFGAFLKETVNKQTNKLLKKSKESGLFH